MGKGNTSLGMINDILTYLNIYKLAGGLIKSPTLFGILKFPDEFILNTWYSYKNNYKHMSGSISEQYKQTQCDYYELTENVKTQQIIEVYFNDGVFGIVYKNNKTNKIFSKIECNATLRSLDRD